MRILLVGGGSGGPVSPLLAVAETIKKEHTGVEFLLVGTESGPEALMAEYAGIPFRFITAGKMRRYFSWRNILTPFEVLAGFFQSLKILNEFKPDCVFGTGSFAQVPLVWAAYFKNIPVVLHQQDILPSLANKLCQIAAKKITVTFEGSLEDFYSATGVFYKKHPDKVTVTGNPFREHLSLATKHQAIVHFNLEKDFPTLLVLGGGTGANFLNTWVAENLKQLSKTVQIIHSTGSGKFSHDPVNHYHPYEFIPDMDMAYAAADIVLARAGLSTITELSNLKKVSILVPIPHSHQELNALYLGKRHAALVGIEDKSIAQTLVKAIRRLLFDPTLQTELSTNIGKIMPTNASKKIADLITQVAYGKL